MKKILGILVVLAVLLTALSGCSSSYDEQMPAFGNNDSVQESKAEASSFPLAGKDDPNKKIVWTGRVRMQTTDWSKTVSDLTGVFKEFGVEVLSAEENSGSSYYSARSGEKSASYELRVPSEKFADFFDAFSSVNGSVISAEKSREDMTRTYDDNALRISLLETEYNELKELMEKAGSVDEVLSIRDRMTNVLYELESLNKANNQIDYDVSWSRVTLTLEEVIVYTEVDENFGERVRVAVVNGWSSFVVGMQNLCVWFLTALPWLILLGGIAALVIILIRRGKKKRRARREAQQRVQQ